MSMQKSQGKALGKYENCFNPEEKMGQAKQLRS